LSTGAFNFRKLGRVASVLIASLILAEAALAQSAAAPRPSPPIWIGNLSGASPGYIHAADILVGHARNIGADTIVMCGGKPAENLQITPDTSSTGTVSVRFSLPQIEPGFVDCRLRNGAQESLPSSRIQVMDIGGTLTELLTGNAMYQKVDVTDFGLDIEHATLRPIRNARIEVYEAGRVISVSDTDNNGEFVVAIPPDATDMIIRAVSRLRSVDLKVEDNTNASQFYYISSAEIDMRDRPARVSLVDRTRKSGAFNILEQIQRSNDFVHAADPQFQAFPFVIFWSERNQKQTGITSPKDGLIGTTFFSLTSSTAYILGDRNTDSDEYDDSVLIHEYAHMLAAKFSRDDSIGGPTVLETIWIRAWHGPKAGPTSFQPPFGTIRSIGILQVPAAPTFSDSILKTTIPRIAGQDLAARRRFRRCFGIFMTGGTNPAIWPNSIFLRCGQRLRIWKAITLSTCRISWIILSPGTRWRRTPFSAWPSPRPSISSPVRFPA